MEHDGIESSEIGQLGQSELDGIGRSGLGMSEFDMSSPLNYGTPSSNNPVGSQVGASNIFTFRTFLSRVHQSETVLILVICNVFASFKLAPI